MKKLTLTALILVSLTQTAWASNWQYLGTSADEKINLYVDKDSIEPQGLHHVSVWVKYQSLNDKTLINETFCLTTKKLEEIEGTNYSFDGSVNCSVHNIEDRKIIPDSLDDTVFNYVVQILNEEF